jgi:hypothetical protein
MHPAALAMRPGEAVVWRGRPSWRAIALTAFHIRGVGFYCCLLLFANAVAAHFQHLSTAKALVGEEPIVILGCLVMALTALVAWGTARSTLYTITNQRVVMQYGMAVAATLALPMRVIASVAVSEAAVADIVIRLKPGEKIAFAKLWPHVRPWRLIRAEPMLLGLADAAEAGRLLARTVAAAQAVEHARPAPRVTQAAATASGGAAAASATRSNASLVHPD